MPKGIQKFTHLDIFKEFGEDSVNLKPKHKLFIEWYVSRGLILQADGSLVHKSAGTLATELGVSRQTLYNWRQTIPDFKKHASEAREALLQHQIGLVWQGVLQRAIKGDAAQAEMFLATFDTNYISPRQKKTKAAAFDFAALLDDEG